MIMIILLLEFSGQKHFLRLDDGKTMVVCVCVWSRPAAYLLKQTFIHWSVCGVCALCSGMGRVCLLDWCVLCVYTI